MASFAEMRREHRASLRMRVLTVACTDAQRECAQAEAAAAGLSVQAWMRQRLFGETPDTRDGRTRRRSGWSDE